MYVYGLTPEQLYECESDGITVNADHDPDRKLTRFTLKPAPDTPYRKLSPSPNYVESSLGYAHSVREWKWRKVHAVCWHGHYVFLKQLFAKYPDVKVTSNLHGKIVYNGRADFNDKAPDTKHIPLGQPGNIYESLQLKDCCNCEGVKNG